MRTLILTALLVSSALYPSFAQDEAKPPVSVQQQNSVPDNREVGRDWKLKPDSDQTVGKAGGAVRDNADRDDQKVDRDWRVHPRNEDDKTRE